jgi:hypothetical protein
MRHHEGATLYKQKIATGISVPKRTLEPMIWLVDVFTVYIQTDIYYITTRYPPMLEEPVGPNYRLSLVRV